MKKLLGAATAATILFASGMAFGAEATGQIQAVDAEAQEIRLDNGMIFSLGEGVSIDGLKAGDEVKITYEEQEGEKVVIRVTRPES